MIASLFYGLFFFVPLVLFPYSSELFEFNKIVLVYVATVLIVAIWLSRCLVARRFIFRRTILDIPILIFIGAMALSTFYSIDVRTSILGYYSRFHGGLLSYLSYSLLYSAYVSNMDARKTLTAVYYLLTSTFLVSVYGIMQHFGIDKDVWVQDVQNRIFSTLGQPNWLAAWMVAILPLTWAFGLRKKFWLWPGLSALFFAVLLLTKSRSGLLGFVVADAIFWGITLFAYRKKIIREFLILNFSFLILALAFGTPFTVKIVAPETGGTESGEIRKIVWKGATALWKKYPILGTGPETFAYSYYETRPVEHNLVSEWDFLYNKAHNEYLNFAATTGTLGLIAYLGLIVFAIHQILIQIQRLKIKNQNDKLKSKNFDAFNCNFEFCTLNFAFLAGFASILVTNFFGFSVVPVALLFFMFPAMACTLTVQSTEYKGQSGKLTRSQVFSLFFVLCTMLYALFVIGKYWFSDFLYARGKAFNDAERYKEARNYLAKTVKFSPNEGVFWSELSRSTAALSGNNSEITGVAVSEGQKAVSLSPRNLNLQRNLASIFIKLSANNPSYLLEAKKVTENAIVYAPTDAKLYYNLALTIYRLGQTSEALKIFDKTIEMKANYKNARFAKALILIDLGRKKEAKEELTYILEKIEPNDNLVKEELKKL